MSLLEKLKSDRIQAMKCCDAATSGCLSVIITDAMRNTKTPTDDEVIAIIKKDIEICNDVLVKIGTTNEHAASNYRKQIEVLSRYLPAMVCIDELKSFISTLTGNKGMMMKAIKSKYGQAVDMTIASKLVSEIFK